MVENGRVLRGVCPQFQDSNGDGVGDLNGIIARLDYLADIRHRRHLGDAVLPLTSGGFRLRHHRPRSG